MKNKFIDRQLYSSWQDRVNFTDEPISIYIHWPFCLKKCPYCDFNSHVTNLYLLDQQKFLQAYIRELDFWKSFWYGRKINSIYFGGGTPSLMNPSIVGSIIEYIESKSLSKRQDIEITLEANPTSIESSKLSSFKGAGINRISIGVQSLRKENLHFLGREHSVQEALEALNWAQEIFGQRFSFDLIYGLPGQSLIEWEQDLRSVLGGNLKNAHISLYQLTIEKGTKFFSLHKSGAFVMPDENLQSDFYDLTKKVTKEYGFNMYEISNYSLNESFCSQHNLAYWNYNSYLGIGPGAHSRLYDGINFYAFNNIYQPDQWLRAVEDNCFENGVGLQNFIILDKKEAISELILMGLRLKNGINQNSFKKRFGEYLQNFIDEKIVNYFSKNNFLLYDNEYFKLSDSGLKISDYIIKRIVSNLI